MKFIFEKFSRGLHSLFETCFRAHQATLILAGLITLGFASILPQLKTELQTYNMLDLSFKSTVVLHHLKEIYEEGHSILLFVHRQDHQGITEEQACKIQSWIHQEELTNAELDSVVSPFALRSPSIEGNKLWYRPYLPLPCEHPTSLPLDLTSLKNSPWGHLLTDREGKDLAFEFRFKDSAGQDRFGAFDPTPVGQLIKKMEAHHAEDPTLFFEVNGDASFEWHFHELLRRDSLLNLILLLVFFLFFRYFFGTWRAGALFVGTLMVTAILIYGGMAITGVPIDLLSSNIFIITCLAGVEDFLFLSYWLEQAPVGTPWIEAFRTQLLPGFFTSLTTFVGFASLCVSDLKIIRRFGAWSAWGSLVEFVCLFLILPAFCKLLGNRAQWVNSKKTHPLRVFERLKNVNLPRWGLRLGLVLFATAFLGFWNLNFNASPSKNFLDSHPHTHSYQYLKDSRGWEGTVYLTFPAQTPRTTVDAIFKKVQTLNNVVKVDNPYLLLDWLKKNAPQSTADLIEREFSITALYRSYFARDQSMRGVLFLQSIDVIPLQKTIQEVNALCRDLGCRIAGEAAVFAEYSDRVSHTLVDSFALSLFLIGLVIFFLAKAHSITGVRGMIYSTAWCPVIMIGVIAALQVQINLVTCLFAAVMVGLTGDNAVQYLFASKSGDLSAGIEQRAGATVLLSFLLAIISLFLLGLTLVPMKILGGLFFAGFTLTVVGDLWILRGINSHE